VSQQAVDGVEGRLIACGLSEVGEQLCDAVAVAGDQVEGLGSEAVVMFAEEAKPR
jgi:hypothetical protein